MESHIPWQVKTTVAVCHRPTRCLRTNCIWKEGDDEATVAAQAKAEGVEDLKRQTRRHADKLGG